VGHIEQPKYSGDFQEKSIMSYPLADISFY
jgi:hypothetical protein